MLLVRHAHARSRKDWSGDDRRRPLSAQGLRQADGLVAVVHRLGPPGRVFSSPFLRCTQTMEPLCQSLGVDLEEAPEVSEGERAAAISFVRRYAGTDVAVCTHGDVIAEILVSLADEDRVDLGPNPKQAKSSVWALEGSDGHFTRATYYPPVVSSPS